MNHGYWVVGRLCWRKNGTADAILARNKTDARQLAERQLAQAVRAWPRPITKRRRMNMKLPPKYLLDCQIEKIIYGR